MDILRGIDWLWLDVYNALFKGWCQQIFVFNVMTFYFIFCLYFWWFGFKKKKTKKKKTLLALCSVCVVIEVCVIARGTRCDRPPPVTAKVTIRCEATSWPDDEVLIHQVDVTQGDACAELLPARVIFFGHFKLMHLLFSVYFLVLIVTENKTKTTFV